MLNLTSVHLVMLFAITAALIAAFVLVRGRAGRAVCSDLPPCSKAGPRPAGPAAAPSSPFVVRPMRRVTAQETPWMQAARTDGLR